LFRMHHYHCITSDHCSARRLDEDRGSIRHVRNARVGDWKGLLASGESSQYHAQRHSNTMHRDINVGDRPIEVMVVEVEDDK